MKKSILFFGINILMLSCHEADIKNQQKEQTKSLSADTVKFTGDNMVKSEAPDAGSKIDQGYCLSRHNNGKLQSPINIISLDAKNDDSRYGPVSFQTDIVAAENLGHTIQIDFKEGSTCLAEGKQYFTKQFHFHTPSEHMIDGVTFPLEMHIVNILKDVNQKTEPSYLVIAVLFKMGKENKFINEFLNQIPKEDGGKDSVQKGSVNFPDLSAQLSLNSKNSWFEYDGSLTTAPFTERVHWIILKQILEASPGQIYQIGKTEGNNARHIQAQYDRVVLSH